MATPVGAQPIPAPQVAAPQNDPLPFGAADANVEVRLFLGRDSYNIILWPMEIIVDGRLAALNKGSSFDYIAENRFFTDSDSYTLSMEFPLQWQQCRTWQMSSAP